MRLMKLIWSPNQTFAHLEYQNNWASADNISLMFHCMRLCATKQKGKLQALQHYTTMQCNMTMASDVEKTGQAATLLSLLVCIPSHVPENTKLFHTGLFCNCLSVKV
jgi:hypothetical protein